MRPPAGSDAEISPLRLGWLMVRVGIKVKVAHLLRRENISLSARDVELLCAVRRDAVLRPDGIWAAVLRERPAVMEWINKNVAGRA
mgnify:CR=1 FL=1